MPRTTETASVLDQAFRPGSQARKIAEILLDGLPHSREELAAKVSVSPTSVPRVVKTLRRLGVPVEASLRGREAVYRVEHDSAVLPGDTIAAFSARGDRIDVETPAGSYSFVFRADGTLSVRTPRSSLEVR